MRDVRLAQTEDANSEIETAVKSQSAEALTVQTWAMSVLQQPRVDFGDFPALQQAQSDINSGIDRARGRATDYLDNIQPNMITQLTNIDAYFNVQNAIPAALKETSDAATAIRFMEIAKERSQQYQADASTIVRELQRLRGGMSDDAADFNGFVVNLNAAVDGDGGVLDAISGQLRSIDGKIAGASVGVALSSLAIAGGAMIVVVGLTTAIPSGGATIAVVAGGAGLVAVGVGGAVASSIALAGLLRQKSDLISQRANLKSQVAAATTVSSAISALSLQTAGAATAAQTMANAWSGLESHLGNLIADLRAGSVDDADIRALFQAAANGGVADIRRGVSTIQSQLSGVETVVDVNTPVAELIDLSARRAA